jgi:hypothetical protein
MFEFRLARELKMTVGELHRRMAGLEMTKWAAFYSAEAELTEMARKKAEAARGGRSRGRHR